MTEPKAGGWVPRESEPGGSPSQPVRGVRWSSDIRLGQLPLVSIATGPDPERRESRGHALGIIAIGDIATGVLALGGVARGGIAIGGVALGVISVGGLSAGAAALGGLAVGGLALGGAAIGGVAIGGLAIGYYALGGAALGPHAYGPLGSETPPQWLERVFQWVRG